MSIRQDGPAHILTPKLSDRNRTHIHGHGLARLTLLLVIILAASRYLPAVPPLDSTHFMLLVAATAGRYRILRRHAEGGLGAVYLAHDEELHREVALKEILERHSDNDESRQRFLLEAEVTGGLEHPGIVPVYGLGEYPDGRPFYAMKFIRGESLKKAVKEFHEAEALDRDPGERSVEFRRLLTHFVDLCEAIAYAHSRGVLHRDIKPENVMVGKFGETLVVDWGLAKPLGRSFSQETAINPDRLSSPEIEAEIRRAQAFSPTEHSRVGPNPDDQREFRNVEADPYARTLDMAGNVPSGVAEAGTIDMTSAPAPSTSSDDRTVDLGPDQASGIDHDSRTIDMARGPSSAIDNDDRTADFGPEPEFDRTIDMADSSADETLRENPAIDSSVEHEPAPAPLPFPADRTAATVNLGSSPPPSIDPWLKTQEERPLVPASLGRSSRTLAGSRMGTPAFMSPEQAAGLVDQLGPASDIYSLGATLYNILTGEYSIKPAAPYTMLARVIKGDFPAPRTIKSSIPPALEAIVLKAMALRPEDRYPTAKSLSEDLEHWMADEPVSAYPEPLSVRVARWGRRHKTTVSTAAALLIAAVVGLSGGSILLERERARTERERELAVKNYGFAHDAAETMLSRVGDVDLADIPQMEPVRRELLQTAKSQLAHLLGQKSNDPEIILLEARTRARLGSVLEMMGQYVDSEKDYRQALESLKSLASKAPEDDRPAREMARAHHGLGVLLRRLNRFREAEAELREAVRLRAEIATKHADDRSATRALADSRYQLGALLARLASLSKEDEELYRQAIQDLESELSLDPSNPEHKIKLAQFRNNLANLEASRNPTLAEKEYRKILDLLSAAGLGPAQSALPGVRWQVARASNNLAKVLSQESPAREEAAEVRLNTARDEFARLSAEFPQIRQYRRELASAFNNLGLHALRRKEIDRAVEAFRQGAALLKDLTATDPQVPDYQQNLSIALFQLEQAKAAKDLAGAKEGIGRILADQEAMVQKHPDVPDYRSALGRNLTDSGLLLLEHGEAEAALPYVEKASTRFREALQGDPGNRSYKQNLYDSQFVKLLITLAMNKHRAAAVSAEAMIESSPTMAKAYLSAAEGLVGCMGLADADQSLTSEERAKLTEVYAQRAVDVLREGVSRGLITAPKSLQVPDFIPLRTRQDFRRLLFELIQRQQPVTG